MASTYRTPGVYVEEIRKFPPSVAPVSTAVPAFIGYTMKHKDGMKPMRIDSMLEFEQKFGGAFPFPITLERAADGTITINGGEELAVDALPKKFLYYAVRAYFLNGGGPCWIVSVGVADDQDPLPDHFSDGITSIEKIDEPTLIVVPEAVSMGMSDYNASFVTPALQQCKTRGDRFTIIDVPGAFDDANFMDTVVDEFRQQAIPLNLDLVKFGAAYAPYLATTYTYEYDEEQVDVTLNFPPDANGAAVPPVSGTLASLKDTNNAGYNQAISAIREKAKVLMPPSAFMAGAYAATDNSRGVWKAPANISLAGVTNPKVTIGHLDQGTLNVDPNAGKSINAIRTFIGKGVLVWGARTLAGNDNEWRYIPVRRYFNFAEESIKKATERFVFEPNDRNTWVKVRAMIENFLIGQWKGGALAGSTPEAAFYVRVGLGETMSNQDILEGRMNIEIGLAVVRPAEFIILKFSHKMQEA